jgi:hypothetical protein
MGIPSAVFSQAIDITVVSMGHNGTSVKCFRNYLQANGIDQEFESFETGVLDSRLKEYYASARKADAIHD